MSVTRLVTLEDAPRLTELLRSDRRFLAPWQPMRNDSFFTSRGQRAAIEAALEQYSQGATVPLVIRDASGEVVGRIALTNLVRGPFQSCHLWYWVAQAANGRGLATAAVGEIKHLAFETLGLHRVEAGTLLHNVGSQRVLERNGFVRFGIAPAYLEVAGVWQDHALYQVLASPADGSHAETQV